MPGRRSIVTAVTSVLLLLVPIVAQAGPTVLFDQGHGQRFLIDREEGLNLSGLAGIFREAGYTVSTTSSPFVAESFAGMDVLVISGAFQAYSQSEIEAIVGHLQHGGTLCIMLHVAPPLASLLHRLGVEHSNGVIREQEDIIAGNPLDFRATRLVNHPLFQGIREFSLFGAWALLENGAGVQSIARTSPSAWIDLNRNGRFDPQDVRQSFAVAVAGQIGSGRFVVFGDDAVFQNKFLVGDNRVLGRNLAAWLAPGNGLRRCSRSRSLSCNDTFTSSPPPSPIHAAGVSSPPAFPSAFSRPYARACLIKTMLVVFLLEAHIRPVRHDTIRVLEVAMKKSRTFILFVSF